LKQAGEVDIQTENKHFDPAPQHDLDTPENGEAVLLSQQLNLRQLPGTVMLSKANTIQSNLFGCLNGLVSAHEAIG
jgi:hypothetical protein